VANSGRSRASEEAVLKKTSKGFEKVASLVQGVEARPCRHIEGYAYLPAYEKGVEKKSFMASFALMCGTTHVWDNPCVGCGIGLLRG